MGKSSNYFSKRNDKTIQKAWLSLVRTTYLQFLHFSPNNIPFPHTMHVWDIQYFVENLQIREDRMRRRGHLFQLIAHLWHVRVGDYYWAEHWFGLYTIPNIIILTGSFCKVHHSPCITHHTSAGKIHAWRSHSSLKVFIFLILLTSWFSLAHFIFISQKPSVNKHLARRPCGLQPVKLTGAQKPALRPRSPTQPLLKLTNAPCSPQHQPITRASSLRCEHVCNNWQYLLMQSMDASDVADWLMAVD